jgi:hypothetical protein
MAGDENADERFKSIGFVELGPRKRDKHKQ